MVAVVSMSKREFDRLEVLTGVRAGRLRVADACTLLGLSRRRSRFALAKQEHLVERAITDAGYSAEQARPAGGHFEKAAQGEWQRIACTGRGGALRRCWKWTPFTPSLS